MYYDRHSIKNFILSHSSDLLLQPVENKVVVNNLITTTTPSITQHRSDKGIVVQGTPEYLDKSVRYSYSKGIDLVFKEGKFTVIRHEDVLCIEND